MQTEIYYGDISRTENLENYLRETVEAVADEFLKNDRAAHLTVRVLSEKPRTPTRRPLYTCEVIVKTSRGKGIIKVKKSDFSFKTCVAKVSNSLRIALARQSDLRTTFRRRHWRYGSKANRWQELARMNEQEVA